MAKLSLVAASLLVAGSLAFIGAAPRAGARAPAALRMGLADDIKATVGANDVTVYSKSTCPFCKRTKASLADLGIAAKIIEARARAPDAASRPHRALASPLPLSRAASSAAQRGR